MRYRDAVTFRQALEQRLRDQAAGDGTLLAFLRLAGAAGLRGDLQSGHRAAAALFDPVLKGDVEQGVWDPKTRRWSAL